MAVILLKTYCANKDENLIKNLYSTIHKIVIVLAPMHIYPWVVLGLRPANERRRYKVTPSLTGWAQA